MATNCVWRSHKHHLLRLLSDLGRSSRLEMGLLHSLRSWIWAFWTLHGVSLTFTPSSIGIKRSYSWAHEICASDNEERAIVVGSMNEMAYVLQAWLPLI